MDDKNKHKKGLPIFKNMPPPPESKDKYILIFYDENGLELSRQEVIKGDFTTPIGTKTLTFKII